MSDKPTVSERKAVVLSLGGVVWLVWMGMGFFHVNPDPTLRVLRMVSGIFTMQLCILAAICQEGA